MKYTKTLAAVAGVGLVAAGLLSAAPASADPVGLPAGGDRALAGVGSDTTFNVMNAMGEAITIAGVKQIASWDAFTSASTFQTRTGNAACTYSRTEANGSSAGRSRLIESLTTGNARSGCLDFARSSSARGSFTSTPDMTWVPFATDTFTFAVRPDGGVPRNLTLAQIIGIYQCLNMPDIVPVLPQVGSGTRSFWLTTIGVTEAQISAGTFPCLIPTGLTNNGIAVGQPGAGAVAGTGRPYPQEHDTVVLKVDEISPFSVGLYNTQASGVNTDRRGTAVLGQVADIMPQGAADGFSITRPVFNIIPTTRVATAPWSTVFVGGTSLICQNTAIMIKQGFSPRADCGDTSSVS